MANLERATTAVDAIDDPALRERAEHYSRMALRHSTVTITERRGFYSKPIRYLNNFVKACVLDISLRCVCQDGRGEVAVADIASGRGQDHGKLFHATEALSGERGGAPVAVTSYYGLDLSAEDTVSAQLMAAKYLPRAAHDIRVGDMGRASSYAFVPAGAADIVSCQLALHYLFVRQECLAAFFEQAARMLRPDGVLVVSYVDGRSVVRRARNGLGGDSSPTVRVTGKFYTYDIPTEHLRARVASPFGMEYVFTMPDSVEGVPEFLASEGTVKAAAAAAGFVEGSSMYFDQAATFFQGRRRYAEIARKMGGMGDGDLDALEAANLYRFNVFATSTRTLRHWDTAMIA